jgi:hypothetical protein
MNSKKINIDNIQRAMKSKGYRWFENDSRNYNLNIVGVRHSDHNATNKFDDWITLSWKFQNSWFFKKYPATTDPGWHWLHKLLNPKGAAILVPGQYDAYALDYHQGKYKAMCQRRGPVKVYRDKNKDKILDLDPSTIDVGWFGINIHRANVSGITDWVNMHSAGCQVFQNAAHFADFMSLAGKAAANFGNKFTYTLLDEKDLG